MQQSRVEGSREREKGKEKEKKKKSRVAEVATLLLVRVTLCC